MFVQQLYTGCISEAAYYIESNGEAAIIDPLRDIDAYLQLAAQRDTKIKYIFETHFHADFVSGHLDLAAATGASIIYGPNTVTKFDVTVANDNEIFELGDVNIQVLHTPGHTLESSCYLLKDETGKDYAIFTGDTLFVGDVGRPDLAQKDNEVTIEDLAGMLYASLHEKIMPLADGVIVYPAHGAGSSCGKNLGSETFSTIGVQKLSNYALQPQTKEAFITALTQGLAAPPQYFPINAKINKEGYESLDTVLSNGLKALTVSEFKEKITTFEPVILDTRNAAIFTQGFIPTSISIGLEGRFAELAGSILPFSQAILLVCEPGTEKESIVRLARVGFENIIGHIAGGFNTWAQANESTDLIIDVEADELAMDIPFDPNMVIVDVRKTTEFDKGHLKEALTIPVEELTDPASMANFDDNQNIYIHCAGGYRSVIASSLIKRQGIHNIRNVIGGYKAICEIADKFEIEETAVVEEMNN
jgi:glyoxylase-like metal-dependent hydrolase (beta-lactamase superfamily II)/rhodanese-related sulfurtransferase